MASPRYVVELTELEAAVLLSLRELVQSIEADLHVKVLDNPVQRAALTRGFHKIINAPEKE